MSAPLVLGLADRLASEPLVTGRKAATLAHLLVQGFPVPPGCVVTTEACRSILDSANLGSEPTAEQIASLALPEEVVALLIQAISKMGDIPLAVRSSAVSEDLAGASYAGQYETVLGVQGIEAVADAIRHCLASAFSARVAAYGGSGRGGGPGMAVLIQSLVPAIAAGVAFTANPVTGDRDQVLVSAVRGLGERLVGGLATPDEWVVREEAIECIAAPERAIDAKLARRVADLARRIEAVFGIPQDIEWALAGDDLHLLQARPITALPQRPEFTAPVEGYWIKDDSHFPMPLTPFGASIYPAAVEYGTSAMFRDFGLLAEGMQQRSLGGEVYMRVVPPGGKEGPAPPWWVLAIVARLLPALRRRARIAKRALASGLAEQRLEKWHTEWRGQFIREAEHLRARDLVQLSDDALRGHLDEVLDFLLRGQVVHFDLVPPYGQALYELDTACHELLGWEPLQSIELVAGTSAASSEPQRALAQLAAGVAESPAARAVVEQGGADLPARLVQAAPDLGRAFAGYLERYGFRAASYDPGDATLAERPELLAMLLRDLVHAVKSNAGEDLPARRREQALARARAGLQGRSEQERQRFERALVFAERAYPVREDNIWLTDNVPCALARCAALEFGRRLTERGRLDRPQDAVYLEQGELRVALEGDKGDLRALVARRSAERRWVVAHPGPVSYGTDPGPPPDIRGLPKALRHVNGSMMWTINAMIPPPSNPSVNQLRGIPGSPGRHTGPVRILRDESEFGRLRRGDVLVCPATTPAWSILFAQAGALVTDGGGVLSHAAVIAREYGIPAVLGTRNATRRLHDGQSVTVDGTAGIVSI